MYFRAVTLLLIVLMERMPARAQSYWESYELINTQQGLPHNTVLAVTQDSRGYLWIGTYNGLCVYDGHDFRTLRQQGGEGFMAVNTIYEDRQKNIWIGSWKGRLSCFRRDSNRFTNFYPVAGSPFNKSRIKCLYEDSRGRTWIGYDNGLLGSVTGDSIRYQYHAGRGVELICETTPGTLTLLTTNGLLSYSIPRRNAVPLVPEGWYPSYGFSGSVQNGGNTLFVIGTRCMLTDLKSSKVSQCVPMLPYRNGAGHLSCSSAKGFAYTNGLVVRWYDADGRLRDSLEISDNAGYDRNVVTNCMTEDRSHILWIGTNSGLLKIDRQRYRFVKYSINNASARLERNYIRSLFAAGDEVWVGFKGGPVTRLRFNNHTGIYDRGAVFPLRTRSGDTSADNAVNALCRLQDGRMIAGGAMGIHVLEPGKKVFEFLMPGIVPDSLGQVWALHQDPRGYVWVGTNGQGMYIIHPGREQCIHYANIGSPVSGVHEDDHVWNIYRDRSGRTWIGTDKGLYRVRNEQDIRQLQFEKYSLGKAGPEYVWSFAEDRQGRLWVGTAGDGLYGVDAAKHTMWKCSKLPVPIVSGILPDAENNLWIGTVDGLYKYTIALDTFTRFGEQDGLISNDLNFKAACTTPDGYMLFGSKVGMSQFLPAAIVKKDLRSAPVQLTGIAIAGKEMPLPSDRDAQLSLSHRQNFFEIDFAVLDFSRPRDHAYRYILQGFDKEWRYTEAGRHQAVYTNVPPGRYHFSVQGSADGSQWSQYTAGLNVHIRPALWQRPAFWLVSGGLVLAAVALAVYRRMRRLIEKERETHRIGKKMAELELQALQSQMNPHFIFNTLNSIQHFIVHNNEIAANDYLSRFSRLMRLFLDSSKSRYISVHNELEILKLYLSLEKLRFNDSFDYEIETEDPGVQNLLMPSMLVQPFAENAVLHGLMHKKGKGLLKIRFSRRTDDGTYLQCIIDDNGVGRERSAAINAKRSGHVSRGMKLIEERIRTYNFIEEQRIQIRITDRHFPLEGTLVEIMIPVNGIVLKESPSYDNKRHR